ncbi:peptidyl-prolyl cis-trans isomerase CYP28, chloroplastic [Magnolia sinica]|uniref:peptidyl-prolyl cis-trans isomerase CYP28, chloroplastic n=1 Tax=Magnolia sinica TaxID=86752 RepID=UPI00265851D1|nr:peptidyl-prolyl cis-trans isomerase CYP28, chloroplastic [Magnolia sinica]
MDSSLIPTIPHSFHPKPNFRRPSLPKLPPSFSSHHSQNTHNPIPKSSSLTRRSLLFLSTATSFTLPSLANDQNIPPLPNEQIAPIPPPPSPTITDRVFLDFTLCPTSFIPEPTLGDAAAGPAACSDSVPLGRVVLGLYGHVVPRTVANFKSLCTGSSGSTYKGTLVHKIFQGQYFVAGRQGRRDKGEVKPPLDLVRNPESVDPKSFSLKHSRPGTLSLCLSENDDEDGIKLDPNYRNVEFLITTGPGPCPELDNQNIVFGEVLEGIDVVASVATIPTYKPAERIRQFNDFAEFLGDERAQNARTSWNRPLKTVFISDCGELKVAKPSLSPSLP